MAEDRPEAAAGSGLPAAIAQTLQRYLMQQEALVRDAWTLFEAPIQVQRHGRGAAPPKMAGRPARFPAASTVNEVLGRVVENLDVDYRLVRGNREIFRSLHAAAAAAEAIPDPAKTEHGDQWRQLMPPPPPPPPPPSIQLQRPDVRSPEERPVQRNRSSPPLGEPRRRQNRRFPCTASSLRRRRPLQTSPPPPTSSAQQTPQRDQWQLQQQMLLIGQWQQRFGLAPTLPVGARFDATECRRE